MKIFPSNLKIKRLVILIKTQNLSYSLEKISTLLLSSKIIWKTPKAAIEEKIGDVESPTDDSLLEIQDIIDVNRIQDKPYLIEMN